MDKIINKKQAIEHIKTGSTVMVGGFLRCGAPNELIDEMVENAPNDLTLIMNDTSFPDSDKGKLIVHKKAKKLIVSHIGTNPETQRQMNEKEIEVEFVPIGTLVERIRSKGTGLGGVLTPTGVGTIIAEGKQTLEVDGKKYLLETALGADVALIYGTKADKHGNVSYHGTTRNLNTVMATAGKTVIVEVDELVDTIDPNDIIIPSIFVDYIVVRENK